MMRSGAATLPLLPIFLLLPVLPISAEAMAGYRFDNAEDYLADASALPAWAHTLERQAADRQVIRRCLDDEGACEGRLGALRHVLLKGAQLDPDDQLTLVNRYVNRRRYRRDGTRTSLSVAAGGEARLRNHWSTLLEFLDRGGDCEDYATAKYFLLRELGFPADDLRVLVTFDRSVRQYHAVLAVRRSDGTAWLLESDNTIQRSRQSQYRFIYAVNEEGIWDHEEQAVPGRTFNGSNSQGER